MKKTILLLVSVFIVASAAWVFALPPGAGPAGSGQPTDMTIINATYSGNITPNTSSAYLGSPLTKGGLAVTGLAAAGAATVAVVGTGGATTYSYCIDAIAAAGTTACGASGSTAAGNATLSGTNYNRVTWAHVPGASGYHLWRTVGGVTRYITLGHVNTYADVLKTTGTIGVAPVADTSATVSGLTGAFPLLGPDGTASSPSYSFTSDPNSGLYSAGADRLGFSTGGSKRVEIDSGGSVGIGVTAPYNHILLEVGTNKTDMAATHQVAVYAGLKSNSVANGAGSFNAGFETSIGTIAGSQTLELASNYSCGSITKGAGTTITRTIGYETIDDTAGTNNAVIASNGSAFTGDWFLYYPGSRSSYHAGKLSLGTTDATGMLTVKANSQDSYFRSNTGATTGYSRLFVQNDSPKGYSLMVYGSAFAGTHAFGLAYAGLAAMENNSFNGWVIGNVENYPLIFETNSTERMRIAGGGDVTITGRLSGPRNSSVLSRSQVDVGGAPGATALFTVPTGSTCLVTEAWVRSASANFNQVTDPVFNIGWAAVASGVVPSATYITPSTTGTAVKLAVVTAEQTLGTTGQILNFNLETAATASTTAVVDVYGNCW